MNGNSDDHHPAPWIIELLRSIGRIEGKVGTIEGKQAGIKDQLDRQDVRMEKQDDKIDAIVSSVAVLNSERTGARERAWWKDPPVKELALLAMVALSGLGGILQPGEVKSSVRTVVLKATGGSP
jgi:hypothetical protein